MRGVVLQLFLSLSEPQCRTAVGQDYQGKGGLDCMEPMAELYIAACNVHLCHIASFPSRLFAYWWLRNAKHLHVACIK